MFQDQEANYPTDQAANGIAEAQHQHKVERAEYSLRECVVDHLNDKWAN